MGPARSESSIMCWSIRARGLRTANVFCSGISTRRFGNGGGELLCSECAQSSPRAPLIAEAPRRNPQYQTQPANPSLNHLALPSAH